LVTRANLKSIVRIGLIGTACWNIQSYTGTVLKFPQRDANAVVQAEEAWTPIHKQLAIAGYTIGDIGYVTARSLRGEPLDNTEVGRRTALYYAVIPLNLARDDRNTPFVIGDFRLETPPQLPPDLTVVFDSGNGLVLLKRSRKP
jgi:hypothetical protein